MKKFVVVLFCVVVLLLGQDIHAKTGQEYFHDYEASLLLQKVEAAMMREAIPVAESLKLKDAYTHAQIPSHTANISDQSLLAIKELVEKLVHSKGALQNLQQSLEKQASHYAERAAAMRASLEDKRRTLKQEEDAENQRIHAQNDHAARERQSKRTSLERELVEAQAQYDAAVEALQTVTATITDKSQLAARVGERASAYRKKVEKKAHAEAEERAADAARTRAEEEAARQEHEAAAAEAMRLREEAETRAHPQVEEAPKRKGFFGAMWGLAQAATHVVGSALTSTVKGTAHVAVSAVQGTVSAAVAVGKKAAAVGHALHARASGEREEVDEALKIYLDQHESQKRDLSLVEGHFKSLSRELDSLLKEQERLAGNIKKAEARVQSVLSKIQQLTESQEVKKALADYTVLLKKIDQDLAEVDREQQAVAAKLGKELTEAKINVEKLNRQVLEAFSSFHEKESAIGEKLIEAHKDLISYLLKNACKEGESTESCNRAIREKVEKRIHKLPECGGMNHMKGWDFNVVGKCAMAYLRDKHCSRFHSDEKCHTIVSDLVKESLTSGEDLIACTGLDAHAAEAKVLSCMARSSEAEAIFTKYKLGALL